MRKIALIFSISILLLTNAFAATEMEKLDVRAAAKRYFEVSLKGDDDQNFWSRWYLLKEDSSFADVFYKFRNSCVCVFNRRNYGPRFSTESGLVLTTGVKVIATNDLPVPAVGLILMDDIKATRMAEVEVELEVVGESVGHGQYEWIFNLFPKKSEVKKFRFVFIPRQKNKNVDPPFPGWYLLHKYSDPMYISPQATLEYYDRQIEFLQARAKMGNDNAAYRAANVLARKNQEQLAAYLGRR